MIRTLLTALLLPFFLLQVTCAQAGGFQTLDRATARSLMAASNHEQATVIALWSYDCSHCKKNLGQLAQLARQYPKLKIISIATEPASDELQHRLDATKLPGQRYAYGNESPDALAYAIDPDWHGELPRTFLFDGKGGKTAHSGVLNKAQLRAALFTGPVR